MKIDPLPLKLYDAGNNNFAVSAGLQLLYCAHVHSNKTLFKDWSRSNSYEIMFLNHILNGLLTNITSTQKYSTSSEWLEVTFQRIAKDVRPEFKKAIACQDPERVIHGGCTCSNTGKVTSEEAFYLRYAEQDEFHSEEQFSYAWSRTIPDEKCKCGKETPTGYFLSYPKYLFVLCDNSHKLFENARKHQFKIGLSTIATYKLLGAIVRREHSTEDKLNNHRTVVQHLSFIYLGSSWFACMPDRVERVNLWDNYHLSTCTVETLLFVQTDICSSSQDPKSSDFGKRASKSNTNSFTTTEDVDHMETSNPLSPAVPPAYNVADEKFSLKAQHVQTGEVQSVPNTTQTYEQRGSSHLTNQQSQVYPQANPFVEHNNAHPLQDNFNASQTQVPSYSHSTQNFQLSYQNQTQNLNAGQHHQNLYHQQNHYQAQPVGTVMVPYSPLQSPQNYRFSEDLRQAPTLKLWNLGNSCWIAAGLQMLFCANWHVGNRLFGFKQNAPLIRDFRSLMNNPPHDNHAWGSFYDKLFNEIPEMNRYRHKQGDAGKFYEMFIAYLQQYMTSESKRMLACETVHPTTEGCMACPKLNPESAQVFTLQYSGRENFNSSEEFLQEWKVCFEYKMSCEHNKQVTVKNYFMHWPEFLFVVTSSARQLLINAEKCPFTIGEQENEAMYVLIGAAMHTGMPWYGGHYTAVVLFDSWYLCNDSHSQKVRLEDVHGDVQLLLFKKIVV